jgi:hypothetical protein
MSKKTGCRRSSGWLHIDNVLDEVSNEVVFESTRREASICSRSPPAVVRLWLPGRASTVSAESAGMLAQSLSQASVWAVCSTNKSASSAGLPSLLPLLELGIFVSSLTRGTPSRIQGSQDRTYPSWRRTAGHSQPPVETKQKRLRVSLHPMRSHRISRGATLHTGARQPGVWRQPSPSKMTIAGVSTRRFIRSRQKDQRGRC